MTVSCTSCTYEASPVPNDTTGVNIATNTTACYDRSAMPLQADCQFRRCCAATAPARSYSSKKPSNGLFNAVLTAISVVGSNCFLDFDVHLALYFLQCIWLRRCIFGKLLCGLRSLVWTAQAGRHAQFVLFNLQTLPEPSQRVTTWIIYVRRKST